MGDCADDSDAAALATVFGSVAVAGLRAAFLAAGFAALVLVGLSVLPCVAAFELADFVAAGLEAGCFFSVASALVAGAFLIPDASLLDVAEVFLAADSALVSASPAFFTGFAATFFLATGFVDTAASPASSEVIVGASVSVGATEAGVAGGLSFGVVIAGKPVALLLECTCLLGYHQ